MIAPDRMDAVGGARDDRPHFAEDRYRAIVEGAHVGVYASRPDGRLITCNPAFARILGFSSVDAALATDMATIHDTPGQREAFMRRLRNDGAIERARVPLRRRDGRSIQVLSTVMGVFEAGELVEAHGFILDVTESVQAEAELTERETRFRSAFLDAADAMLILDAERRILDANRSSAMLFGVPIESLAGQVLDTLVRADAGEGAGDLGLQAAWRELMAFGEARREHQVVATGGAVRIVEASYRTSGQSGRHLWIGRDVTDRRQIEERMVQAEKIESVGRLAGGVAHDFNNLLTAILGYTELLLSARPEGDPDRADLQEIQKAGQRAAALTQQLLAYSRKQVLMPKDVDLNRTVADMRSMLARAVREDVRLVCDLAAEPALVRIDRVQFEQVILNLVLNARDAMPEGGEVRLEVTRVRLDGSELPPDYQGRSASFVRVRVVDNGVGISPEVKAHLFEPFFTTKDIGKGSGLGLASVYGVVRQSNGFITVSSEPGKGSTFSMHFPAVGAQATLDAVVPLAARPAQRGTILLVEDEDAVRVIVGAALRRHGFHVLEAATPRGACEIFEEYADDIALLLTDVVMPEMNGPALATRLTALRPSLRVLFISGYADVAPVDGHNPNVGFLSKPFQASVLVSRVSELLAGAGKHG